MPFAYAFLLCTALVAGPKDDTAAQLDTLIPRLMKDGDVPGLAATLVRDGRVAWHGSFGILDATAPARTVRDDSIFEAASLTKPVFAYAVLKLVDQGRLDLDTPLSTYLPGDYTDDPRAKLVTARHVLSHTTGFPNWRQRESLKTYFPPGERFSYSGEGFVYLQKAVERLTDRPLQSAMKTLVFEPLGMKSSSLVWESRFEGRKAAGHDAVGTTRPVRRPTEANAAASLHTTALDYARFLIAALEGAGLKPATAAQMWRPQIQVDEGCFNCVAARSPGRLSKEIAWGLGWGLLTMAGGTDPWHWGDNNGEVHCFVIGDPARRAGLVVFTNSGAGHGIIPDIVSAAGFGTRVAATQPWVRWLGHERYDSPSRTLFKDVLDRGSAALTAYRERRAAQPGDALSEAQVNRVGYWLLGKKRNEDAVAVLEMNALDFPGSWNAHDSLGEAYAAAGQKERAIASYRKSLELNPASAGGAEALKKLAE